MSFERPITIAEALSHVEQRRYLLPAIQREFVWPAWKIEWLFDNDRIAQFLFEATEILKGDERGEIASTVYSEYKAFCRFNGFVPKSAKELTKQLSNKGVVKSKSSRGFDDGGTRLDRYISLKLTATYLEQL